MNEKDQSAPELYIPPHKRRGNEKNKEHSQINFSNRNTLFASRPNNTSYTPNIFTTHARERQNQRDISSKAIQTVCKNGREMKHRESTTYINETIQVVTGKNGTVITVSENKRNTRFDMLRNTQSREKKLLQEIKSKKNNDYARCELAELYLSGELGNREVQKAYDLLLEAAQQGKGNSHAMCLLAQMYERGDLGIRDLKLAEEWMEKAADRNNKYALAIMGQRYLSRYQKIVNDPQIDQAEKDNLLAKAKRYLKGSANKGSTRAMWQIAQMHEHGDFGEKNLPEAIEIYTQAAKLGSPSSMFSLQAMVESGELKAEILEEILDEASKHIARTSSQLAAELGLAQIKGKLGKNPKRGFYLLEQSAEKRNEAAIKTLAKLYRKDKYCPQDLNKSQYWYQQLEVFYQQTASERNVNAMVSLGNLHLYGHCGKIDLIKAEENFIKAAETEDIDAMIYLGWVYLGGKTDLQNKDAGHYWIEKTIKILTERALGGNTEAAMSLTEIYLDKEMGYQDYQQASKWLHFAAEKNNVEAQLKLSILYLKRKIASENIITLIEYIEKNIRIIPPKSISKAARTLGDFYETNQEYPKAVLWYKRAISLNNSIAMHKMGTLYEKGVLGEINLEKAKAYYTLSAARENKDGIAALTRLQNCDDELKEENRISTMGLGK